MIIEAGGFSFDFPDALDVFIFDEEDKSKPTYHGMPMKAVDVVAEFEDRYIYLEIKDFSNPKKYRVLGEGNTASKVSQRKSDRFVELKNELKYKYRDSYLFRHAEGKVEKPVGYICLLSLDNTHSGIMQKELSRDLPVGKKHPHARWKRAIAESCQVVNLQKWNELFPKWPAKRLPEVP